MKILITGAAGFIATNLWRHLEKDGHILTGWDKFTYAANDKIALDRGVLKADIADRSSLVTLYSRIPHYDKPDLIINMAAASHVDQSISDPAGFLTSNTLGTFNILELCKHSGIPLIHFSTDEVIPHEVPIKHNGTRYFSGYDVQSMNDDGFYLKNGYWFQRGDREKQFDPSSPYSASKAAAEMFVNAYKKTFGIPACIVRPCNQYGPYQYPEKLISKCITNFLADKPVGVYGEGLQWRDYMYVDDLCRALQMIIRIGPSGWQDVYHIAAMDERQNIDVVTRIAEMMGKEDLIKFITPDPRPGHDPCYSMQTDLKGFKPEITFREGLDRTIAHYRGLKA